MEDTINIVNSAAFCQLIAPPWTKAMLLVKVEYKISWRLAGPEKNTAAPDPAVLPSNAQCDSLDDTVASTRRAPPTPVALPCWLFTNRILSASSRSLWNEKAPYRPPPE